MAGISRWCINDTLYHVCNSAMIFSPTDEKNLPVEEYVYQGITHYIFGNEGTATAVWMVENTEYYMWVTDATVDIKQLLRSIYASE